MPFTIMEDFFKTEHKKGELLQTVFSTIIIFASIVLALYFLIQNESDSNLIQSIGISIASIAISVILIGVLKKQVTIIIKGNFLTIRNRITDSSRTYDFSQIDGFDLVEFQTRSGLVKQLTFYKDNKPIQRIASSTVTNFNELLSQISGKLKKINNQERSLKKWLNKYFGI